MQRKNYITLFVFVTLILTGAGCDKELGEMNQEEQRLVQDVNVPSAPSVVPSSDTEVENEVENETEASGKGTENTDSAAAVSPNTNAPVLMENTNQSETAQQGSAPSGAARGTASRAGSAAQTQPTVKSFTVTTKNFSFSVNEIRVKKGDTVKLTLVNEQGFHDWVVDEFNARTEQIGEGETASVEFVASKAGTFEYYCSVGSHRAMGMKGKLIVE